MVTEHFGISGQEVLALESLCDKDDVQQVANEHTRKHVAGLSKRSLGRGQSSLNVHSCVAVGLDTLGHTQILIHLPPVLRF